MTSPCEQTGLHSIDQAISQLTALLLRHPLKCLSVPLTEATGRILAQDVKAQLDTPQWDNSAMDGYAFNSADLDTDSHCLPLSGCIAAGDPVQTLSKGHCTQIFTGAPLPIGADTVIAQENCQRQVQQVIFTDFAIGQNIRRQGEESRTGQLLLEAGSKLRAQEIGLLASQGYTQVCVYQALRIGIISSGNELCAPGETLKPGQIYDANSYTLNSLLQGWGFNVTLYPRLKDTLDDTLERFKTASQEQDILISSGGVSVGDADFLKMAVKQLGQLNLWRVAIQPGKPLAFGTVANTPWIGLPGNPAATLITALIIIRPALLAAQGQRQVTPLALQAYADFNWPKARTRQQYLQARLLITNGIAYAQPHPKQSSAMLANCCWAEGLVVIAAQQHIQKGDPITFIPYQTLY